MVNVFVIPLSLIVSALYLYGLYRIQRRPQPAVQAYRLFLIVFLAVWSSTLWLRPYRPTVVLAVVAIFFAAAPFLLALLPPRKPKSRRETKALLEMRQTDRWLEKCWTPAGRRIYGLILAFLTWSVGYRLIAIFALGNG